MGNERLVRVEIVEGYQDWTEDFMQNLTRNVPLERSSPIDQCFFCVYFWIDISMGMVESVNWLQFQVRRRRNARD